MSTWNYAQTCFSGQNMHSCRHFRSHSFLFFCPCFLGRHCDEQCECLNGGTCSTDTFKCICRNGFSGPKCENSVTPQNSGPSYTSKPPVCNPECESRRLMENCMVSIQWNFLICLSRHVCINILRCTQKLINARITLSSCTSVCAGMCLFQI